jgi:anti-sigma regulatory factor (Ser/Thr protein kinase)
VDIRTVIEALDAVVLAGEDRLDTVIETIYASDLMSDVLAFGEPNSILLTGLANQQSVISAQMAEFGGVVLVRGKRPRDESARIATKGGLVLLTTRYDMYEACVRIHQSRNGSGPVVPVAAAAPDQEILLTREFLIEGSDFTSAGMVSTEVRATLKKIGFERDLIRRIAISMYEAEMNVVMHADDGRVQLEVTPADVRIRIDDRGKGIADIEQAMQPGFTTSTDEMRALGFGAGMGLPNIKKNTDEFDIQSTVGKGTTLRMTWYVGRRDTT